jgi:hypothetical protein
MRRTTVTEPLDHNVTARARVVVTDPDRLVDLDVGRTHLAAPGCVLDVRWSVAPVAGGTDESPPRAFDVELVVHDLWCTESERSEGWLGSTSHSATVLRARAAVALLGSIEGARVVTTSLVAEPAHGVPVSSGARIVVRDGGSSTPVDVGRPGDLDAWWGSDPSSRRPVRLDGRSAAHFLHHLHWIPAQRGFLRAWVQLHVPGWNADDLSAALKAAGVVEGLGTGAPPKLAEGVTEIDVEPEGVCSRIEFEAGMLVR